MTLSPWEGERPYRATMRDIAERVAAEHDLSLDELRSPARPRHVAHPRQSAMAEIYATGRFSLKQIGLYFRRDHTTVLFAVRAHERRLREGEAA